MSRKLKKEILQIFDTLNQCTQKILQFAISQKQNNLLELLTECQKNAIKLGERIELTIGNPGNIITLLEDYCEIMYCISQAGSSIINADIFEKLAVLTGQIEEELRNMEEKTEILFLPYKAAMWDSLESVWLSAKEDKACETYVMPIPYFSKTPVGDKAQEFYEGHDFPSNVPVTDYQEYRIDIRKPDIIYIHNPYDQYNKVTAIKEDFYCKNIKKHTDMLVYIPYFIVMDQVPEHFCVLPGTIYADRIILQSEEIRRQYINEFKKLVPTENADEKFQVLGSPKIDKIVNAERLEINIPKEWRTLTGNKKVVLYNTSVQCLIEQKEQYITKIKYVLNFFKNHEKYVLLWRPHPLVKATIGSILKSMEDEYEEMVNTYRKEKWGIYDDTSEFTRAILISDAYMGDMSSVAPLYLITKKPILIQNYGKINDYYYDPKRLWFEDMLIENKTAWISSGKFNGLFRLDLISGNGEFIGKFPNEENIERLYNGIIKYESLLIFTPMAAREIAMYDTLEKTFKKIKLDERDTGQPRYNRKNKFFTSFVYEDWLIMGGGSFPAIIKYNLKTEELIYDDKWVNQVEKISEDKTELYFRKQYHLFEGKVLFPLCCTNAVLEYTILSGDYEIHRVGDAGNRFNGICFDGKDYWLSPRRDGRLLRWDKESGEWENFQCMDTHGNADYFGCSTILFIKNQVWLFPLESFEVYHFDIKSLKMFSENIFQDEYEMFYFDEWSSVFSFAVEHDDCIYIYNGKKNQLLVYDSEFKLLEKIVPRANYELENNMEYCSQDAYNIFYESGTMSLNMFLSKINVKNDLEEGFLKKIFWDVSGGCGQTIHIAMKKLYDKIRT